MHSNEETFMLDEKLQNGVFKNLKLISNSGNSQRRENLRSRSEMSMPGSN
jgi:hypothetical protein